MKKTTLTKSALMKAAVLPEVFLSDSNTSTAVGRMVRAGTARKISPRLYTRNLTDEPKDVVARNLWQIVALLMPGAVVSHRRAQKDKSRSITIPGFW